LIIKLNGELGSHGAEIEQLTKDITANLAAQKEAQDMRDKENGEYATERTESEQCIGALEAAIKALSGAGEKKGFLETLQEAQVLSVVEGVRNVIQKPLVLHAVSRKDMEVVKRFLDQPEDFVGGKMGRLSAAQVAQNPFGDYAPQSTQIQGILKGMYDTFTADLEKDNAEEANQEKSFQELMATKKQELATLQNTLAQQKKDDALKSKELADSETSLDDTKEQVAADETFFDATKASCKTKAAQWAVRSRLRTEELTGIIKALSILESPESRAIFQRSATTLLQFSTSNQRNKAYAQLRSLAAKFQSTSIANIAVAVKTGWHFDEVIAKVDQLIALLRQEEKDDIYHRDRCEANQNKNTNEMDDIGHDIKKANSVAARMEDGKAEKMATIKSLEASIGASEASHQQLLNNRNSEEKAFKKALKDDTDAVALLTKTIETLRKFYRENRIDLGFAQQPYTVDPDKAPEIFKNDDYHGRGDETHGIVEILMMIKEDLEKEIQTSQKDDRAAQADYMKDSEELKATIAARKDTKLQTEQELADLEGDLTGVENMKLAKTKDLKDADQLKETLNKDCAWVKENFEKRKTNRQAEMEGLVDAKDFLAGVSGGSAKGADFM